MDLLLARARRVVALLTLSVAGACASAGQFVWADDYASAAAVSAENYAVGVGDLIVVSVWGNDRISSRSRVRSDGRISVPLLNDVDAVGRTPAQLAADIEARLKKSDLVLNPRVTVQVDEVKPLTIPVLGKVSRAGTYPLEQGAGVADALAAAGGLNEFAKKDMIFVLRRENEPVRIRFTFSALTSASSRASVFRLRPGDIVVAE